MVRRAVRQEIFYEDYFRELEQRFPNFAFQLALSEPLPSDNWRGHTGLIHDILRTQYLERHADPRSIEYYLCGPPMMIQAAQVMLKNEFGINSQQIAFDEF